MKVNINSNGSVKVVTDSVDMPAVYLNPSFEFDEVFGSVNLNIAIPNDEYQGSELEGAILASEKNAMDKAKKENPKAKNQMSLVSKAIPEVDDDGNNTGRTIIKLKNKAKFQKGGEMFDRKLMVVDGLRNKVENYTELTGGTKGKVSFTIIPWFISARKEVGISCWLNSIQVLEPVFYEGGNDFEDEEGCWTTASSENVVTESELLNSFEELD